MEAAPTLPCGKTALRSWADTLETWHQEQATPPLDDCGARSSDRAVSIGSENHMHYAKLTLAGGLMVALYSPAMAQVNPNVDCTNPTAAMSAQCRTSPRDPTEGNRNTTTGGANTGA